MEKTNESQTFIPENQEKPLVTLQSIEEKITQINEKIEKMQGDFERKIKVDTHKDKMFDNMHDELTKYRNDVVTRIANSIILDIIQLLDVYRKIIAESEDSSVQEQMQNVCQDLEDILYRNNVEPFSLEEIDLKQQKIVKYVKTDNEELHNTIAQHLAPGYEKEGKVIRPERIAIYRKET